MEDIQAGEFVIDYRGEVSCVIEHAE